MHHNVPRPLHGGDLGKSCKQAERKVKGQKALTEAVKAFELQEKRYVLRISDGGAGNGLPRRGTCSGRSAGTGLSVRLTDLCHAFAKKREERLRGLSFVTFGMGRRLGAGRCDRSSCAPSTMG